MSGLDRFGILLCIYLSISTTRDPLYENRFTISPLPCLTSPLQRIDSRIPDCADWPAFQTA